MMTDPLGEPRSHVNEQSQVKQSTFPEPLTQTAVADNGSIYFDSVALDILQIAFELAWKSLEAERGCVPKNGIQKAQKELATLILFAAATGSRDPNVLAGIATNSTPADMGEHRELSI